jgi:hypothetical protein
MNVNNNAKCRILSELFVTTPNSWRVVGITDAALIVFHNYKFKKEARMGINRAHLVGRKKTYEHMLENPIIDRDEWWNFYRERDKTVLATTHENLSKGEIQFTKIDHQLGLFKHDGYAWAHSDAEITFLKKMYHERIKGK